MRYFINRSLKSTISTNLLSFVPPVGYVEVSKQDFDSRRGDAPLATEEPSTVNTPVEMESFEEVPEGASDDLLDSIIGAIGAAAVGAVEEDSEALVPDSSVLEFEESEISNSFESIKELRARADKSKEARVTKGKAHGVYRFQNEAWERVGDL